MVRLLKPRAFCVSEVSLKVRPHLSLFIGACHWHALTVHSWEGCLTQVVLPGCVAAIVQTVDWIQLAWEYLDILLLRRFHAPSFEVDCAVDVRPDFDRLLEAEVVMTLFQSVKIDVLKRSLEFSHVFRRWHRVPWCDVRQTLHLFFLSLKLVN